VMRLSGELREIGSKSPPDLTHASPVKFRGFDI
jgi:hypothetical protein